MEPVRPAAGRRTNDSHAAPPAMNALAIRVRNYLSSTGQARCPQWRWRGRRVARMHTCVMSVSPEPVTVCGSEPAAPRSLVYPRVLLAVQSALWGLVAVGGLAALAVNARGIISGHGAPPHGVGAFAVDATLVALAAGMAAVSAVLSAGLQHRRPRARVAAIALECFMTCFGLYLAWWSVGGFLAGGAGAMLSCAAVVCLLGRPARRFTRRQVLKA